MPLQPRKSRPGSTEGGSVGAEDIRDLQRLTRHGGAGSSVTPKKKRNADTAAFMPVCEAPFDRMCS